MSSPGLSSRWISTIAGMSAAFLAAAAITGFLLLTRARDLGSDPIDLLLSDRSLLSMTTAVVAGLALFGAVAGYYYGAYHGLAAQNIRLLGRNRRLKRESHRRGRQLTKTSELLDQESRSFVGNWSELSAEKDRLREENHISEALLRMAQAVGSLAGPDQVLETISRLGPAALGCDECLTAKASDRPDTFVGRHGDQELTITLTTSPSSKILLEDKRPVLVEPGESPPLEQAVIDRLELASGVLIPFVAREKVTGMLLMAYHRTASFPTARQIELAEGISAQITVALENAQLYRDTIEGAEEISRLLDRLAGAHEQERRRISRDLHDGVVQTLSGMSFSLSFIEKAVSSGDKDAAERDIDDMKNVVEASIAEIRQVIYELRPTLLDSMGLVPTIQKHLEKFSGESGVKTEFESGLEQRLSPGLETALFRLVQESLNNIKKHAKADTVTMGLSRSGSLLTLTIEDDGVGFDPNKTRGSTSMDSGFGLSGMRERVRSLGGRLSLNSAPGSGTRVKIETPFEEAR